MQFLVFALFSLVVLWVLGFVRHLRAYFIEVRTERALREVSELPMWSTILFSGSKYPFLKTPAGWELAGMFYGDDEVLSIMRASDSAVIATARPDGVARLSPREG